MNNEIQSVKTDAATDWDEKSPFDIDLYIARLDSAEKQARSVTRSKLKINISQEDGSVKTVNMANATPSRIYKAESELRSLDDKFHGNLCPSKMIKIVSAHTRMSPVIIAKVYKNIK